MIRAVWKVPYISPYFIYHINKINKTKNINTWIRKSKISNYFVNKRIRVYNGNKSISFIILPKMVGHCLGEFSITKVLGSSIIKSKEQKMILKRKMKKKTKKSK